MASPVPGTPNPRNPPECAVPRPAFHPVKRGPACADAFRWSCRAGMNTRRLQAPHASHRLDGRPLQWSPGASSGVPMPAAFSRPAPGRQTAVDKALFLLTSLAEQDGDVGVSELARRARLTKSTAFRRLGTRLHDMGNRVDGPPRSSSRNSSCPTSPTCLRQQDPRPPHDSLALPDRRPPARLPHRRRPHPPRGHRLRPPGGLPRPHLRRRPRHGPRRTAGRRPLRRRRRPPLRPRPPRPRPAPRRLRRLPHPHRLTTPPRAATRSPCHPVAQRRDP